jgi:hypothetical protein
MVKQLTKFVGKYPVRQIFMIEEYYDKRMSDLRSFPQRGSPGVIAAV